MSEELKACPFCGGKARKIVRRHSDEKNTYKGEICCEVGTCRARIIEYMFCEVDDLLAVLTDLDAKVTAAWNLRGGSSDGSE